MSRIEPMHRGPAGAAVTDISRNTVLTRDRDQPGDKTLLDRIMDLRQSHDRRAYAAPSQQNRRLFRGSRIRGRTGHWRVFFGGGASWRKRPDPRGHDKG